MSWWFNVISKEHLIVCKNLIDLSDDKQLLIVEIEAEHFNVAIEKLGE